MNGQPGRPKKLSADEERELRRWGRIGRNMTEAAGYYGVCESTIRHYLNDCHRGRNGSQESGPR